MRKAVFLDRDGVINRAIVREGRPFAPTTLEQFEIFSDAPKAVDLLHQAGFILIVATNQPDVGHGLLSKEIVEEMHNQLRHSLPVDDIRVCYNIQTEQSVRRKPQPGMLLEAADIWNIDLSHSFMVGDRWSDVEAGRTAGCQTVLIQRNYKERCAVNPNYTVHSLWEASQIILKVSDIVLSEG